ncbi:Monocarboxylate transporter 13 like protein [Argiope bruennichi]|uniref:Monocarboxylate transporter 13 like protein n=1 Tax=Argiope bruennichi TaxID=94029 RepID=A0A8T0EVU4_ARGBR|nr:Monocarboxylate transporter 13 like protein [Argiope bruennichi]
MDGPDQGWAWAVALAACAINFIMAGLGRMSGILYVAFIDIYRLDRKGASTPFSVRSSTRNLLGPVVGILGQKYGNQVVIISGAVMSTISTILCFFVDDIGWITVLWGGLGGAGTALTTVLVQVVVGQYFKKYRTTAIGMGFSGGCVGSFLFPALMEWLLNTCGIEGTFLIIAGIIMHCIPAAMILRKPPWLNKKPVKVSKDPVIHQINNYSIKCKEETKESSEKVVDIQFLRSNSDLILKLLLLKTPGDEPDNKLLEVENASVNSAQICILESLEDMYAHQQNSKTNGHIDKELACKNNVVKGLLLESGLKVITNPRSKSFNVEKTAESGAAKNVNGNWTRRSSIPDVSKMSKKVSRQYVLLKIKNILYTNPNQIPILFPDENRTNILKVVSELRKLYCNHDWSQCEIEKKRPSLENSQKSMDKKQSNSFWTIFKTMIKLFRNPLFVLVCLCRTVHFLTFLPIVTTIVDFAIDRGFREDEGSYVIAALSLGDLLGRLCLGWVTDKGFMGVPRYLLVGMVLQGVNTATIPFMPNKATVYVSLCIFGMLQGSLFVRHPVLVQRYMRSDVQSLAIGCMNFFPGLLGMALPLYIGYFRDTLGTYDYFKLHKGFSGIVFGSCGFRAFSPLCFPPKGNENS